MATKKSNYSRRYEWPKCVEVSTEKLEPHRISVYLYELASEFHSYWNMGKDDISKRFIEEDNSIKEEKLVFLKSIANTIKSGMDILGVDTPEKCNDKRIKISFLFNNYFLLLFLQLDIIFQMKILKILQVYLID